MGQLIDLSAARQRLPRKTAHGPEGYVRTAEVARHLSVSERTVRRLVGEGMPSKTVRRARLFRLSEVERWFAER
jgi:excisionase family DNA binding protein